MRRLLPRPCLPVGLIGAVVFFWLSLTPGLLPRDAPFQGVLSGVSALVGYGLGVAAAGIASYMVERELRWRPGRRTAYALLGIGLVVTAIELVAYLRWQAELRSLMGMDPASLWQPVVILALAGVTFVLLLGVARALLGTTRWAIRQITRVVAPRIATVIGGGLALVLLVGVLDGVVATRLLAALDRTFEAVDQEMTADTLPPVAAELSGSPQSLLEWESLGRQGREFVTSGPTTQQLSAFNQRPSIQPVRSYVGLQAAGSIRGEAALAVEEIERVGGFDRAVLCVVTTTGTGWVNENAVDTLEYLYNGDSAVVSLQYSYLPSWLSFMVDQARAREAGRELFDAVYAAWRELPAASRPRLVVNGESLGSFGAEAAFSGVQDLRTRTDGALFVGPPFMNDLWRDLTDNRDPGSPEWLPIYEDGEVVRFVASPADLDRPGSPWPTPRVVYLQHASDPITWWTPDLIFHRPDWLEEERGPDVLPGTRWFPVVTFLQLSADMAVGHLVPDGYGHSFGAAPVDAWVAILDPPGWSGADTTRLREVIATASLARRAT